MNKPTRRQLMGMALAGAGYGIARAADTDPSLMIVRSPSPTDLEMPLSGFTNPITPIDRFFVRCHTYTPKVDLKSWSLKVDGVVNKPLTLTLADLKRFPRAELVSVIECAGNGRAFYRPQVTGTQWTHGGVSNGRWAGVRLKDVLARAGMKSSATQVLCDGADTPIGNMEDLRRSVTVEKALHPDTLLAYELNGEPLPVQHGFPLRLVAPGWAGDSWIKWLQHIEVLDHDYQGFWMKTGYRHPDHHVAPGSTVPPSAMVSVTNLGVKSEIATPTPGPLLSGSVKISGAAWSDGSPIAAVDVSTDGGKQWTPATLGKDLGRYSWRLWELPWTPPADGEYLIMSRARTVSGAVQPLEQEWNPSGYLWNVIPRVTVQAGAPASYRKACFVCHDEHMMRQQVTRAQWDKEIDKMVKWGAHVDPADRGTILDYLSSKYKP